MIEIEKKFSYDKDKLDLLVKDCVFLKKVRIVDVYLDDSVNYLFNNDLWLRKRDGLFELKIPLDDNRGEVKSYREISDLDEIKLFLGDRFYDCFNFLTVETIRSKYVLGDVNVDIDDVLINGEKYFVGELEIVCDKYDSLVEKKLDLVMERYGLSSMKLGKLTLYLKDFMPDLFFSMIENKVISEDFK